MALPRFKSQWSEHGDHSKTFFEPSLTVPDMSLSPREIIDKYSRNEPIDVGTYDDEFDINDMDLTERFPQFEDNYGFEDSPHLPLEKDEPVPGAILNEESNGNEVPDASEPKD